MVPPLIDGSEHTGPSSRHDRVELTHLHLGLQPVTVRIGLSEDRPEQLVEIRQAMMPVAIFTATRSPPKGAYTIP